MLPTTHNQLGQGTKNHASRSSSAPACSLLLGQPRERQKKRKKHPQRYGTSIVFNMRTASILPMCLQYRLDWNHRGSVNRRIFEASTDATTSTGRSAYRVLHHRFDLLLHRIGIKPRLFTGTLYHAVASRKTVLQREHKGDEYHLLASRQQTAP